MSLNYSKLSFIFVVVYLSFINFFVFKATPEIYFFEFTLLIFLYRKSESSVFLKKWVPFISLFLLYEFIRGWVDNISPFYNLTLYWIYILEKNIFTTLPTQILQKTLQNYTNIMDVLVFFYSTFFYFSFLVAFVVYLKNKNLFSLYAKKFILLTYFSLFLFFIFPTAPPWMVSEINNLGLVRVIYESPILKSFTSYTTYQYFIYGNPVAAMPSLHVAWPAFSALFLQIHLKKWWSILLIIVPLMISLAVVVMAEHYVLDVFVGWILAYIFVRWGWPACRQGRDSTIV